MLIPADGAKRSGANTSYLLRGGNPRNSYGMFKPHERARLPRQKVPGVPCEADHGVKEVFTIKKPDHLKT